MKKKPKSKELSASNFFITDEALKSAQFDEFGHSDYAKLLEKLIQEQPTPFNIGIFGRWGVGKSTIVNFLKERLEEVHKSRKTKIIEVKVWKYDENSLRRKFILKIAEGLGLENDLDEINRDIYYEKKFETALLNFKDIVLTILNKRSVPLWVILISLTLLLIIHSINLINVQNQTWNKLFQLSEDVIILPLFVSIVLWVFNVINKAKLKLKIGKFDSEEQFENKFIDLIKKDRRTKVIFIDDLDRCSKEKVVKTLETIKTFLDVETCIFIIACDDEIIIDAINRTHELYNSRGRNEGAEYLEKFFQYTIYIPPFMIPDMRKYINAILKRNKSDLLKLGQILEEIIFILINKDIKNPRNAITIVNSFSAAYLLAKEREEDTNSRLHNKIITDNLPILAIIIRIRYHFPEFYNDLLKNNDLIFWLLDVSEGNYSSLTNKQVEFCKKYFKISDPNSLTNDNSDTADQHLYKTPSLNWNQPLNENVELLFMFLESIKGYLIIKNLSPFLYLGIDSTSYLVGDEYLQEFNDSLKNGIDSKIEKILGNADEIKKAHFFDHACDWIDDKLEGAEKRKALQSLSKQFDKCPKDRLIRVSNTFSRFYSKNMKFEEYKKYHPSGIFKCANYVNSNIRLNLLTQAFAFLNNQDLEHDKLILNEVFKNESIIIADQHLKSIRRYLDTRVSIPAEDDVVIEVNETKFLEFEYIKEKIIEFKDSPNVLNKFFSGNIVDEVVDYLIEIDEEDSSTDEEKYEDAVKIFEILKGNVINNDKNRLCDVYKKLIETTRYYEFLLEDIQKNLDIIPFEQINSLAIKLLDQIPNYIDVNNEAIEKTFDFTVHWFEKYPELSNKQILPQIIIQLIKLFKSESTEIFQLGANSYLKTKKFYKGRHFEDLFAELILLLDTQSQLVRTKILKEFLIEDKDKMSLNNKKSFINKLIFGLNSLISIRNDDNNKIWFELFSNLIELFNEGELDQLLLPNDANNILSISFPGATIDDRTKFCKFINYGFTKLSELAKANFFDMLVQFLSTNSKENAEYAINNIYLNLDFVENLSIDANKVELLVNQFNLEIDDSVKFKNILIIFSARNLLSKTQIDNTLKHFSGCLHFNPEASVQFFLVNWNDFTNQHKFDSLKQLILTKVIESKKYTEDVLIKIKNDYNILSEDDTVLYINELEKILKDTVTERDFFAKFVGYTISLNDEEFIKKIRANKISEIKAENEINLCRNKFTIIIGLKDKNYEKDKDINDLFFLLLNDKLEKKKLAIDVFEYYYEKKHPYNRKSELTETFNNLLGVFDNDYRQTVKRLANKYDLKIKKSLFENLFGG